MPTILILDDDATDAALIHRVGTTEGCTVLTVQNLGEFHNQMTDRAVGLVMISLAAISRQDITGLQPILHRAFNTKVVAMVPFQPDNGLTILLRAESLQAHHLMAKPIDPQKLLALLDQTFSPATQQY